MNQNHEQIIYHVNVNLLEQKAFQIRCECKKHYICEKDYVWNPSACICEKGKYLASIMDGSAIICDEIIYAEETNFNEKKYNLQNTKFPYFTCIFINSC